MPSFLTSIAPYLTAAGQGVAAFGQGQQQGKENAMADYLRTKQLERQQADDALKMRLGQSSIDLNSAHAGDLAAQGAGRSAANQRQLDEQGVLAEHLPVIQDPATDDATRRASIAKVVSTFGDRAPAILKDLVPPKKNEYVHYETSQDGRLYGITANGARHEIQDEAPPAGPPTPSVAGAAATPAPAVQAGAPTQQGQPPAPLQVPPTAQQPGQQPGQPPRAVRPPTVADALASPLFGQPHAPIMGSPEWIKAQRAKAQITADAMRPKYTWATDPTTGKQVYVTEEQAAARGFTKPESKGGATGSAQNMQARLIGAVSEGRLADERMTKFEDAHLKDGKMEIGVIPDVSAGLATGLAGAHSITGIIGQKMGQRAANATDPAYLQYQRDARLIARAEQLMSARGGSEAMASDNAFLASGGANAPESTVRAARLSRRALFGKLGAVMQTLSPDQASKLADGLKALHEDDDKFDYGGTGAQVFGATAPATPGGGRGGNPNPTGSPPDQATGDIDLGAAHGATKPRTHTVTVNGKSYVVPD